MTAAHAFTAIGTTAVVVAVEPDALAAAVRVVEASVASLDRSCSRFRDDSELTALNRSEGRPTRVSATLLGALVAARRAAVETGGLVDPTIGRSLRLLGYDRDFGGVAPDGPPLVLRAETAPGWQALQIDADRSVVVVPRGVEIDLGATAKAWCADQAAGAATRAAGCGVLVSLGGDVAVAGTPPDGGWVVRIADRHDAPDGDDEPTVTIVAGGLATSGTAARRWRRGGKTVHHIVDPVSGHAATACWRTVSVAASTCLGANAASTAAVVLGPDAPAWLETRGLPARLAAEDGSVTVVAGWPADEPAGARS